MSYQINQLILYKVDYFSLHSTPINSDMGMLYYLKNRKEDNV